MLYPVLPVYLKSIGFSMMLIGILEGLAEATAGLSKGYFGNLSDQAGKRVPFVRIGYALSALSKPMMAAFAYPFWILLARTIDRLGKGVRTGPRDALLSDDAAPGTKGKVFGFHRSMDTIGAVIGPSLALLYLYFYPGQYKALFVLAFLPGLLAVLTSLCLRESRRNPSGNVRTSFFSFLNYWLRSPAAYRRVVSGLLVFALFNSSDVFLLLKAKESGIDDTMVIGVYIFYNLIFALFAFPVGIIADKIGLKKILMLGLALFAIVYAGMSFNENLYGFFALFFLYGLYAAATEGISKAWISHISDSRDTATAIGTYSGFQSVCAMLASALTGFLWSQFNATVAFLTTATITLLVVFYFVFIPDPVHHTPTSYEKQEHSD